MTNLPGLGFTKFDSAKTMFNHKIISVPLYGPRWSALVEPVIDNGGLWFFGGNGWLTPHQSC